MLWSTMFHVSAGMESPQRGSCSRLMTAGGAQHDEKTNLAGAVADDVLLLARDCEVAEVPDLRGNVVEALRVD